MTARRTCSAWCINNVGGFPNAVRSHAGNAGKVARANDGGNDVVSISAVLGNGDGTFKPAVLTTVLSAKTRFWWAT